MSWADEMAHEIVVCLCITELKQTISNHYSNFNISYNDMYCVSQRIPTWLTRAGAIVLLICSTAFETPARNKQTITDLSGGNCAAQAGLDIRLVPRYLLAFRRGSVFKCFSGLPWSSVSRKNKISCSGTHSCPLLQLLHTFIYLVTQSWGQELIYIFYSSFHPWQRRRKVSTDARPLQQDPREGQSTQL